MVRNPFRSQPDPATDAQVNFTGYRPDRPGAVEARSRTEIGEAIAAVGIELRGDLRTASLVEIGEAVSAGLRKARPSKAEASAMIERLTRTDARS